jgi:hypothetical protein
VTDLSTLPFPAGNPRFLIQDGAPVFVAFDWMEPTEGVHRYLSTMTDPLLRQDCINAAIVHFERKAAAFWTGQDGPLIEAYRRLLENGGPGELSALILAAEQWRRAGRE